MKATHAIAYILGAASGAAVAWFFTKKKYEQILDEEIQSVKEVYSKNAKEEYIPSSEELEDYENEANAYNTVDSSTEEETVVKNEIDPPAIGVEKPYVIPPEEFGEFEDYEQVSLTYYEDHILTDDMDNIIEDVEEMIGFESLTHFGEYEDDSVFVRNDAKMCDYEILKDVRTYAEALKFKSRSTEV